MIVTEKEARELWCPHARVPGYSMDQTGIAGLNDYGSGYPTPREALCRGSRCMQWRWEHGGAPPKDAPGAENARGFCGLSYSVRLP